MKNNIKPELNFATIVHNGHNSSSLTLAIEDYLKERNFNERDAYEYAFCKSLEMGIVINEAAVQKQKVEQEEKEKNLEKQEVLTIGNNLFEEMTTTKVESNTHKILQKIKG